jgi:hypothetical protein
MESPNRSPSAYRTFPRKLPLALTGLGGALVVLGGIGTWVRATTAATEGIAPQEVDVVSGFSQGGGQALIFLGIVAVAAAFGWLSRDGGPRAFPIVATVVVIGIGVWQLAEADSLAARMAADAGADPAFTTYHAAFGWGAWLLLAGLVVLFLGLLVGVLREIDLRHPPREVTA